MSNAATEMLISVMEMLLKVMTAFVGISAVQLGVLFAIVVILGLKGR